MEKSVRFAAIGLAAVAQAGCVHTVPGLTPQFARPSGPTADTIVDHIACEVRQSDRYPDLKDDLVTVLLTLQVDDAIDLTPSLALTQNLTKPAVSAVTTLNADLGGARQRTFTATYSFEADKIGTLKDCNPNGEKPYRPAEKHYTLEGNLGVNEIINDGLGVTTQQNHKFVIPAPTSTTDKSGPSFGSKVQFIITQSLTNLGPVWTLKYFKGGGGSNGLLNGKRVDTDSVLITFAPKPDTPKPSADPNQAMAEAIKGLTAAIDRLTQKVQQRKTDLANTRRDAAQFGAQLQAPGISTKSRQAIQAQSADLPAREARQLQDLADAEDTLATTKAIADALAVTKQSLATAAAATDEQSRRSAAASASQQLQTNMLLQTLTVPR